MRAPAVAGVMAVGGMRAVGRVVVMTGMLGVVGMSRVMRVVMMQAPLEMMMEVAPLMVAAMVAAMLELMQVALVMRGPPVMVAAMAGMVSSCHRGLPQEWKWLEVVERVTALLGLGWLRGFVFLSLGKPCDAGRDVGVGDAIPGLVERRLIVAGEGGWLLNLVWLLRLRRAHQSMPFSAR